MTSCRRGDLNPHGTRSRQILSLLRMPISPLRRGRVVNLTSCRSIRQQQWPCDTSALRYGRLLHVKVCRVCHSRSQLTRSNQCAVRHVWLTFQRLQRFKTLVIWVLFWVMDWSKLVQIIVPATNAVSSFEFIHFDLRCPVLQIQGH